MNKLKKEILKDVVLQLTQNDSCLESKNEDIDVVPCAEIIDELTAYLEFTKQNDFNNNTAKN